MIMAYSLQLKKKVPIDKITAVKQQKNGTYMVQGQDASGNKVSAIVSADVGRSLK